MSKKIIYITGAGVSEKSGIPTFRGKDGFWTIGSKNYTPQQMATRQMYLERPDEFLLWYFRRFVSYENLKPNLVHYWLSKKNLVTQNIDGLDEKAGNSTYIPIHGQIDKVTTFNDQNLTTPLINAPWDEVKNNCSDFDDNLTLKKTLLNAFKISKLTLRPEKNISLKPFVLLFDEYYTELYKISKVQELFQQADHMIFMGTSFSVNITNIALDIAIYKDAIIEVVNPDHIDLKIDNVIYHRMKAHEYVMENI